jgi:inner membrane protein
MKGYTHAAVGANTIWLATLTNQVDAYAPILLGVCALAALLPDLDAPHSKIHHLSRGFTKIFHNLFPHRTFFHSLLFLLILFIVVTFTTTFIHPFLPIAITIGHLTHPLIDALTPGGVEFLYPKRKRYHLLPYGYRVSVGGLVDTLLFVAGCAGALLFLGTHL